MPIVSAKCRNASSYEFSTETCLAWTDAKLIRKYGRWQSFIYEIENGWRVYLEFYLFFIFHVCICQRNICHSSNFEEKAMFRRVQFKFVFFKLHETWKDHLIFSSMKLNPKWTQRSGLFFDFCFHYFIHLN